MGSEVRDQRRRYQTGIAGLDMIARGGLLSGSLYIIRGAPGAGKTIAASQICFHWARQGEKSLYITLLSESHDRLIENIRNLEFFAPELANHIQYQSGFHTLTQDGLTGVMRMLAEETKHYNAQVIVLDGLFALQERVGSDQDFGFFLNQLQTFAQFTNSTILMLTNSGRDSGSPEYTMVDGWLELGIRQYDYRISRYIQIHKLRGNGFVDGQHAVLISDAGLRILPRLESLNQTAHSAPPLQGKLKTGVPEFDTMLGGGLREGTNTLLVGPTGIGKTAFGLHFIGQSDAAHPGLIFGFYETQEELAEKAQALNIPGVVRGLSSGAVVVVAHPPREHVLDDLGYALIEAVRERGVKRLFLDGVDVLRQCAFHPARTAHFLAALTRILRDEGVTAVFTLETPELVGGETRLQLSALSSIAQNIVLLRYLELEAENFRTLSIIKNRSSHFDARVRRFSITNKGIRLADSLAARSASNGPHPPEASGSDE